MLTDRLIWLLFMFLAVTDAVNITVQSGVKTSVIGSSDFITFPPDSRAIQDDLPACCYSPFVVRCGRAMIDVELLGQGSLTLPGGISVQFKDFINNNPYHFYYEGNGSTLIITTKPGSRYVHGHATLSSGFNFVLEHCGGDISVFKEINHGAQAEHDAIDENILPRDDLSTDDDYTKVEYSAIIYYTPDFENTTPDIMGYINQVVAETNQGYANSEIPLTLKVHCVEKATINDNSNVVTMIMNFKKMKGSVKKLLGSADVAVLIVNSFNSCGVGFVNGIYGDSSISVVQKSCAVGYYSFGHEIGHNIGLHHNKEKANNQHYPSGYGYLIPNGYRTILAYKADGHETRINYYSNPNVMFQGFPTGTEIADNAHILRKNRFFLAAIGDESEECKSDLVKKPKVLAAAAASPQSQTKTTSTCPIFDDKGIRYKFTRDTTPRQIGECRDRCKHADQCVQWMWRNGVSGRAGKCYHLKSSFDASVGFQSGELDCNLKPSCQMTQSAGLAYTKRSIPESQASACRNINCPGNAVCKLFSFEEEKKICHVIVTYPKQRTGYYTGTPCA